MKLTIKKNMTTPKYAMLATAANLRIAINSMTNIPCIYIDTVDKANLAGQVIEAVRDDGTALTMQELSELASRPHTLKYDSVGAIPNTSIVIFEEKQMVKTAKGFDINSEIDRIVNEGICSKSELEEKIRVMKDNCCSDKIIYDVLAQTREYDIPVRRPSTIYQNTEKKTKMPVLKKALIEALLGHSIIFEGDKSVGKNVCAETVAWLLGKPYYIVGFTKKTTIGEIAGDKTTEASRLSMMSVEEYMKLEAENPAEARAVAAKGQTINLVTEEGELVRWMKNGGLMMFNEVNMADSNLLQSFLNPLADGTGFVTFPGHGRVELNPDCVLIGSQNPGYTGACAQNTATLSRLGKINFPYPESIKGPLKAATLSLGLDDEVYKQCDALYGIFHKAATGGLNAISDNVLNIRGFVRALQSYANFPDDYTLADAIKCHVAAWVTDEERSVIETHINDKITL